MSFFSDAIGRLAKAATKGCGSTGGASAGETTGLPPIPDLASLVREDEIEAVTGAAPRGEPRLNGPRGSEVDIGRLLIREWKLAGGDEFLLTLGVGFDEAAARLAMDRMAELEKPLPGVGERGLRRVKKYRKTGKSEVGVTARQGPYWLSLTHTSASGANEIGPLTDLLRTALARL